MRRVFLLLVVLLEADFFEPELLLLDVFEGVFVDVDHLRALSALLVVFVDFLLNFLIFLFLPQVQGVQVRLSALRIQV